MLGLKLCDYFTLIGSQLNRGKKCPEWTQLEEKRFTLWDVYVNLNHYNSHFKAKSFPVWQRINLHSHSKGDKHIAVRVIFQFSKQQQKKLWSFCQYMYCNFGFQVTVLWSSPLETLHKTLCYNWKTLFRVRISALPRYLWKAGGLLKVREETLLFNETAPEHWAPRFHFSHLAHKIEKLSR